MSKYVLKEVNIARQKISPVYAAIQQTCENWKLALRRQLTTLQPVLNT